jgi:hypothetical protein
MKITKDEAEWMKRNKLMLDEIFIKRKDEFVQALLVEQDPVKSEALKLVVREWDNWMLIKKNIINLKSKKRSEKEFTGV